VIICVLIGVQQFLAQRGTIITPPPLGPEFEVKRFYGYLWFKPLPTEDGGYVFFRNHYNRYASNIEAVGMDKDFNVLWTTSGTGLTMDVYPDKVFGNMILPGHDYIGRFYPETRTFQIVSHPDWYITHMAYSLKRDQYYLCHAAGKNYFSITTLGSLLLPYSWNRVTIPSFSLPSLNGYEYRMTLHKDALYFDSADGIDNYCHSLKYDLKTSQWTRILEYPSGTLAAPNSDGETLCVIRYTPEGWSSKVTTEYYISNDGGASFKFIRKLQINYKHPAYDGHAGYEVCATFMPLLNFPIFLIEYAELGGDGIVELVDDAGTVLRHWEWSIAGTSLNQGWFFDMKNSRLMCGQEKWDVQNLLEDMASIPIINFRKINIQVSDQDIAPVPAGMHKAKVQVGRTGLMAVTQVAVNSREIAIGFEQFKLSGVSGTELTIIYDPAYHVKVGEIVGQQENHPLIENIATI